MCETVNPISDLKCPPEIEGSEKEKKKIAEEKATELYGKFTTNSKRKEWIKN